MKSKNFYEKSHLVVAAIRIWEYQKKEPPSVAEICETLSLSSEQGHLLCRKLHESDIIEMLDGPYGLRLFIKNHLKIEEISKEETGQTLKEEVKKFQNEQKRVKDRVEAFHARKKQEKQALFDEIQKKFRKNLNKSE